MHAQVAMTHPAAVTACNLDLEALISDANRTIATLAITTLLKTGNESSVERLLKQIGSFMSDIADDFKIVVVEAIRSLCLKFPQKCARCFPFGAKAVCACMPAEPVGRCCRSAGLSYPSIHSLCLKFPRAHS
jgi:hypothetical protein